MTKPRHTALILVAGLALAGALVAFPAGFLAYAVQTEDAGSGHGPVGLALITATVIGPVLAGIALRFALHGRTGPAVRLLATLLSLYVGWGVAVWAVVEHGVH
jgi:hypothetical protein